MAGIKRGVIGGSRIRLRLASDDRLVASIRGGEPAAFEALYDRHAAELLSFCLYMLGSHHDAEDAVQASFASAYRALRVDDRSVKLRPWLFTIARNECVSLLRKRRPTAELNGEPALTGDPVRRLELRDEIQAMLQDMRALPEHERAALVLAEVHGLSQRDIGSVLDVRPEQVKAYVYQARSNLISEKRARETDCMDIREELANARGAALLRGRLRRHVRSCEGCRMYADGVARQHRQLVLLFPAAPAFALKYGALEQALGIVAADPATAVGGATVSMSAAGAAAEIAGGGVKALVAKLAIGAATVGVSASVGMSVLNNGRSASDRQQASAATATARSPRRLGAVGAGARGARGASRDVQPEQTGRDVGPGGRGGGIPSPGGSYASRSGRRRSVPSTVAPGGAGAQPQEGSLSGPPSTSSPSPTSAEHGSSGSSAEKSAERQREHEAKARLHEEENVQEREEDKAESEERKAENKKHSPPSEAEKLKKREEKAHEPVEPVEPVGVSRSPKTPEERQQKREQHQRKREERERKREAAEAAGE